MRPTEENSEDDRTVYCGNLSEEVTDEILYELFNQAGPVESVRRPKDPNGRPKPFAFIVYRHDCSVPYSLELFKGTKLFNRNINCNSRSNLRHVPVLDTHITEFTEPRYNLENIWGNEPDSYRSRERDYRPTREENYRNDYHPREDNRNDDYRREDNRNDSHRRNDRRNNSQQRDAHRSHSSSRKHEEKDSNEPTSWAEYNALRGKGSLLNGYRSDMQGHQDHTRHPSSVGLQPQPMVDFDSLLQMGREMMIHQPLGGLLQMGLGPSLGTNMFPSMQGTMSGGNHHMPERDRRGRNSFDDRRDSRRDHPYNDRGRNESHRRHDRGYSSSRSSHDRERRDRRSR